MASCAIGPCDRSLEMGGAGCDMCDRVAKLPQPNFRGKGSLVEEEPPPLGLEPGVAPAPAAAKKPAPAPRSPASSVTRGKRAANGPQIGSLL